MSFISEMHSSFYDEGKLSPQVGLRVIGLLKFARPNLNQLITYEKLCSSYSASGLKIDNFNIFNSFDSRL